MAIVADPPVPLNRNTNGDVGVLQWDGDTIFIGAVPQGYSQEFGQPSDPGKVSLTTGRNLIQYKRLTLTATERLTVSGTARVVMKDFDDVPLYLGTPKTPRSSFTVRDGYFLDVRSRLVVGDQTRVTLEGTADLNLTDDFATRSRIVLSGRG